MNKWLLTAGLLGMAGQALAADTVAPVVTAGVPSGTYTSAQKFKLTIKDSVDPAPVFYFTKDGSVPTTASTRYTGQTITAIDTGKVRDLWLRTLARDASGNQRYQSFNYYIESAPVVTPSVAAGSYSTAQTFTLSVKDESDAAPVIYYTTDGTMPTKSSPKYVAGTKLTANATAKTIDLRLRTLAMDSQGNYQRQIFDYKIATVTDTTAPVASASPTPGTYESTQSVKFTITDDKDSAPKLYYTTDGSAPSTSSTLYTSGTVLTLSKSTLIRTLAVDASKNSRTQEFNYVISTDTVA
ncbi:MAG: chitobiase/beta-hexosaminidase C-terminal domain-containing protein, partial [Aeromonadaceae bacterium]|nr:chitobiase/beta-hexosaminidase C-terminal domain-containing protein [Aeromonadaceae bacterium]